MIIEVSRNPPAVVVNGLRVATAPPVAELLAVIGTPTRVETGPKPAPTGFRNNQQHVLDPLGVHVNEHHHTRCAQELGLAISATERPYAFTPTTAFSGSLLFDGSRMPLNATEAEFLRASPWEFEQLLPGRWVYKFDGFRVGVDTMGPKLASGLSGKQRLIVGISISWPHYPNGDPTCGG